METKKPIDEAYASLLENDFEKAIGWFEKALEAEPDNPTYHHKLSITFARSNRLAKALEHAMLAAELEPGEEAHRIHLRHLQARERVQQAGSLLGSADKRELLRAVDLLNEAQEADPLLVQAKLFLGHAYAALGDYERAAGAVLEAVRLDSADETAKSMLAQYRRQWREQLESIDKSE